MELSYAGPARNSVLFVGDYEKGDLAGYLGTPVYETDYVIAIGTAPEYDTNVDIRASDQPDDTAVWPQALLIDTELECPSLCTHIWDGFGVPLLGLPHGASATRVRIYADNDDWPQRLAILVTALHSDPT